ncbi:uncharacterized protein YjbJ (UPF0337 family) [Angulomicrobium tetraedrale]|uniref:Uncharacterized protein YjbJ (UPF0337 family) n=1 Tax=Ancylobacter tetraedralis TaxID=217068 RepID=A0A839ZDS9_9HYPH|nr:CsbD family protein [Ancylobacter tetraedralis]MBB3772951.1 uncharacterized protein YjbJ (UPF0337 family) [Ancylobacter tetraedralis]
MPTEQIKGTFRIITGAARALWGRLLQNGAMAAQGRVERLAGEAMLVCARARVMPRATRLPTTGR